MKRIVAAVLVAGMLVSFAGCKKKEEKAAVAAGHPSTEGGMPQQECLICEGRPQGRCPKEIAAKWKSVKLMIEDKAAKSSKEYTIAVGAEQLSRTRPSR